MFGMYLWWKADFAGGIVDHVHGPVTCTSKSCLLHGLDKLKQRNGLMLKSQQKNESFKIEGSCKEDV